MKSRVALLFACLVACGGSSAAPAAQPKCPVVASSAPVAAQPTIDGYWTGVLAGKLHLALAVKRGAYTGILDSIDQGAKLPIENVTLDGSTLHFDIPMVQGSFQGKLDATGARVEGTWTQAGMTQPLAFERGTAPPEVVAPPQKPLDVPFDIPVAAPPIPFRAGDKTHLAYELTIDNYAHRGVSLERIEVMSGTKSLAKLEGDALAHATDGGAKIGARSMSTVFMWVTLDGADVPTALDHRITVKTDGGEMTVSDIRVPVRTTQKVTTIGPPLKGRFWRAANGPSNASQHRRALLPIGGHARIAQRFAIDWVKMGDDGKTFTGDASKNASYHDYGAEALAVADGVVTEVKDGIAENVPGSNRAVPMTLETLAGNHVVVDLGGGQFAMWAHFQPGSIKVKTGDHVKRGQVLGLVGNSGNSTEPHLHFQVSDAASPLSSQGVPYAFDAFELRDGTKRTKQIPMENDVLAFP